MCVVVRTEPMLFTLAFFTRTVRRVVRARVVVVVEFDEALASRPRQKATQVRQAIDDGRGGQFPRAQFQHPAAHRHAGAFMHRRCFPHRAGEVFQREAL